MLAPNGSDWVHFTESQGLVAFRRPCMDVVHGGRRSVAR
jgi:hypothetical protein